MASALIAQPEPTSTGAHGCASTGIPSQARNTNPTAHLHSSRRWHTETGRHPGFPFPFGFTAERLKRFAVPYLCGWSVDNAPPLPHTAAARLLNGIGSGVAGFTRSGQTPTTADRTLAVATQVPFGAVANAVAGGRTAFHFHLPLQQFPGFGLRLNNPLAELRLSSAPQPAFP